MSIKECISGSLPLTLHDGECAGATAGVGILWKTEIWKRLYCIQSASEVRIRVPEIRTNASNDAQFRRVVRGISCFSSFERTIR